MPPQSPNYPTAPKAEEMARVRQSLDRYSNGELKSDYAEVPGYWCGNAEETAKVMGNVTKPWIAFKVMAAGAIPPSRRVQVCLQQRRGLHPCGDV